jgi:hypothetical protein
MEAVNVTGELGLAIWYWMEELNVLDKRFDTLLFRFTPFIFWRL